MSASAAYLPPELWAVVASFAPLSHWHSFAAVSRTHRAALRRAKQTQKKRWHGEAAGGLSAAEETALASPGWDLNAVPRCFFVRRFRRRHYLERIRADPRVPEHCDVFDPRWFNHFCVDIYRCPLRVVPGDYQRWFNMGQLPHLHLVVNDVEVRRTFLFVQRWFVVGVLLGPLHFCPTRLYDHHRALVTAVLEQLRSDPHVLLRYSTRCPFCGIAFCSLSSSCCNAWAKWGARVL